jgi:L-seryl-tRNA(Ser) seleniumtransferase
MPPKELLSKLPAVETLLQDPSLAELVERMPRQVLVDCIRQTLDQLRRELLQEEPATELGDLDRDGLKTLVIERITQRAAVATRPYYQKVINATGIILHTGLGRAVLPKAALDRFQNELTGYSLLQTDPETGQRCQRDAAVERLLQRLTGAEAATIVNNNAAATMIVLNTVGQGREIIVSRGQLVEIGGSFRLPDVMEKSGVRLVEVGTTNKTHARDYEAAITDETAAIMRIHPSNYKITGFTSEVPLADMVEVAHRHNLPLIDDVGAGSLIDFSRFGFDPEPTLPESIQAGADLVTCSGDKLIGASQAGIILGRADLIAKIRKNPLARIVRVDKLTLAAMEATLNLFLDEKTALANVPTLALLQRSFDDISQQADRVAESLAPVADRADVAVIDGFSQMGSGSLPTQNLPTRLVSITPRAVSLDELALRLRRGRPPVFARVYKEQVLLDPRTLLEGDETILVEAVVAATT